MGRSCCQRTGMHRGYAAGVQLAFKRAELVDWETFTTCLAVVGRFFARRDRPCQMKLALVSKLRHTATVPQNRDGKVNAHCSEPGVHWLTHNSFDYIQAFWPLTAEASQPESYWGLIRRCVHFHGVESEGHSAFSPLPGEFSAILQPPAVWAGGVLKYPSGTAAKCCGRCELFAPCWEHVADWGGVPQVGDIINPRSSTEETYLSDSWSRRQLLPLRSALERILLPLPYPAISSSSAGPLPRTLSLRDTIAPDISDLNIYLIPSYPTISLTEASTTTTHNYTVRKRGEKKHR
ncbi:hypothetical protein AAG570_010889 [Ranatra chinensis]|uniref:Uncharacterized protein n=1 Tax=Ranatra chinensis TaxID=642074 RepID=A0ABD0YJA5_9HEMI